MGVLPFGFPVKHPQKVRSVQLHPLHPFAVSHMIIVRERSQEGDSGLRPHPTSKFLAQIDLRFQDLV